MSAHIPRGEKVKVTITNEIRFIFSVLFPDSKLLDI